MKPLNIKSFGPLQSADVRFGDLTILVGPQASGKSIFLQLLKLIIDRDSIRKTLKQYNYVWNKDTGRILDLYFGEGMSEIWKDKSVIEFGRQIISKDFLTPVAGRHKVNEELFYIPAQRILSISDGRPKTFTEFDASAPYVLRYFSEILRQVFQNSPEEFYSVFPSKKRLNQTLQQSFNNSIFHNGKVVMDERTGQKKLRLEIQGMSVPFITWSAGQKEFMPMLLAFYWLCTPEKGSRKDNYKYVVIEEPEMGLHPDAIKSVILQIIDLMSRGYKVTVSTHSPVLMEFAWAFNFLKQSKAPDNTLFELFDIIKTPENRGLFDGIISKKKIKTYYFNRENENVIAKDISALDAGSEDDAIAGWGGISAFAGKAADIVAKYFVNKN